MLSIARQARRAGVATATSAAGSTLATNSSTVSFKAGALATRASRQLLHSRTPVAAPLCRLLASRFLTSGKHPNVLTNGLEGGGVGGSVFEGGVEDVASEGEEVGSDFGAVGGLGGETVDEETADFEWEIVGSDLAEEGSRTARDEDELSASKDEPTDGKDPLEMRLSRRIARSGVASRREAERLVEQGVVTVNGAPVLTPALNVGPNDVVKVKGHSLTRVEEHTPKLWLVHKLRSELVTRQDPEGRPTIFDRLAKIKLPDTLMPVGRLDFNTEGLLLLTNDGDLARQMELPSSNIVRTYSVRVYGNITEEKLRAMRSGCTIDGVRYKGMYVRVEGGGGKGREGRNAWLTIECTEGKNRQIRKICKHLCLTVNRLARTRYGPFNLGKVRAGGVARLEIPKSFLRRLQEGTAGGVPGAQRGGNGQSRVGPGPGVANKREVAATKYAESSGFSAGSSGGSRGNRNGAAAGVARAVSGGWARGKGTRIRTGVGAPTSRGDNASRGRARRSP